jgi:hypothetical protein
VSPLLRRRPKLPAPDRPPLAGDERVVAWSRSDKGVLVATNLGLWRPDGSRLGWHLIHKATWSGPDLVVTPAREVESRGEYVVVADEPPVSYRLESPGELPNQVRARVTRSVGYTAHHPVPGVRVAARRVPGIDGLRWTARYDPGVEFDDPEVAQLTARIVAQARE